MSEIVILENKQGSKLFKDRFIHEGQSYLIADMKYYCDKKKKLRLNAFYAGCFWFIKTFLSPRLNIINK